MVGNTFISVGNLEHRPLHFDTSLSSGTLDLLSHWKLPKDVEATGKAELLDREGIRIIRFRGRIIAAVEFDCARCLELQKLDFNSDFDLYFYPMTLIAQSGESALARDETEVGFYEGEGLDLTDVIREQLLLWLPMRSLCRPDCGGICPGCGINRNQAVCDCHQGLTDPRWDILKHLNYKN